VKIQKEFKVTPHYLEIDNDVEFGYKMGVYLCLGQAIHNISHKDAVDFSFFKNFKAVHDFILENHCDFLSTELSSILNAIEKAGKKISKDIRKIVMCRT
jgi:hypothetical protein